MEHVHPGAAANRLALSAWSSSLAPGSARISADRRPSFSHRQSHGEPGRLREMLDVAARHGVKAKTERFMMSEANEAIKKANKNKVRYRAVLAN